MRPKRKSVTRTIKEQENKKKANKGNATAKRKPAVKEKNVYADKPNGKDDIIPYKRSRRNIVSNNEHIASLNLHKLAVGLNVLGGKKGKAKVDDVEGSVGHCATNYNRHNTEQYESDILPKKTQKVVKEKVRSVHATRLQSKITSGAIKGDKQQTNEGNSSAKRKLAVKEKNVDEDDDIPLKRRRQRIIASNNEHIASLNSHKLAVGLTVLGGNKGKRKVDDVELGYCTTNYSWHDVGEYEYDNLSEQTKKVVTKKVRSRRTPRSQFNIASTGEKQQVGEGIIVSPSKLAGNKRVNQRKNEFVATADVEEAAGSLLKLISAKVDDGKRVPPSCPSCLACLQRQSNEKAGSAAEPIPTISTDKEVTGLNSNKDNDGKLLPLSSPARNTQLHGRMIGKVGSAAEPIPTISTAKSGSAAEPIPTISTTKEVTGLDSSKGNDGKTLPLSSPARNTQLHRRRIGKVGSAAEPVPTISTAKAGSAAEPIPIISTAKEVTGLNSSKENNGKILPLSSPARNTRLHGQRIGKVGSAAEPLPIISTAKEVTGLNSSKENDGKTLPLSSPACNTWEKNGVGSKRSEQEKNIGKSVLPQSDVQTTEKSRLHRRRIEKAGPAAEPIPTISTAKEVVGLNSSGLKSYKESNGTTLPLSSPACNTRLLRRKNDGVGCKRPEQEKNIGESVLSLSDVQTEKSRLHRRRIEKAGAAAEPIPTISTVKEVTGLNSSKENDGKRLPLSNPASNTQLLGRKNDGVRSKRPEQEKTSGESVLPHSDVQTSDKSTDGVAQRNRSGKTKMVDSHTRNFDERKLIPLNNKFQPVSDDLISELRSFLGTLAIDHVPLVYVSWHKVPFKANLWEFVKEKYIIAEQGKAWVMRTIRDAWRVYKCRIKKNHYTAYDNDDERIKNRPDDIPLAEFKALVAYWGTAKVKELAEKNSAQRKTAGTTSAAQISKKIAALKEMCSSSAHNESGELVMGGKTSHGLTSLVGRLAQIKKSKDAYIEVLTAKIKQQLLEQVEETVEQKVNENMGLLVEKLAKNNPDFTINLDSCETSSENDSLDSSETSSENDSLDSCETSSENDSLY